MLYNLSNEYERQGFKDFVNTLYKKKSVVEIKEKRANRTLKQNSYLHLILSYFGCEIGYTLEEVKVDIFKRLCNKEIFEQKIVNKRGQEITRLRSSYDLDTKEMTAAIERFRNWSAAVVGLYIPSPTERDAIVYAQQQVERNVLYS